MEQQANHYNKKLCSNSGQTDRRTRRNNDAGATGFFLVIIGVGILMNRLYPDLPNWIFSWKTFLIVLGIFLGYKNRFQLGGWIAPIIIGTVFIIKDHINNLPISNYIWPIALIALGLIMVFKPRFSKRNFNSIEGNPGSSEDDGTAMNNSDTSWSNEDIIDSVNIFSGSKKINISKNFKGGEITNIMGGSELNLSKADIQGTAVLEVTCILGGTKLIVPADWSIQQEAVAILGGIEDKRPVSNLHDSPSKLLILKGTVIMGGIDIRSF